MNRDIGQQAGTSSIGRIAMVSIHGHVRAKPPIGATDTGGQVVYILELARKLASLGREVDIWTRKFDDLPDLEIVAPGVRILRVPCGPEGFVPKERMDAHLDEWTTRALERIAREGRSYSLVSSHYWDGGVAGGRLARELGIRHFHTPHSLGESKRRQMEEAGADLAPYRFEARLPAERAIYSECDLVIATTREMAAEVTGHYGAPPAKVVMIPPGYDDGAFYPVGEASRQAIRKRLGLEGTVFFGLGRLARTKGFDLLVRGFAVAARRIPDAMLLLAIGRDGLTPGQRAQLDELLALARELGVGDRVRVLDHIPHRQTPDHYRAADVFVLSSRVEAFGMTAVEAMACGTPTVVTVHGGLHENLTFGRHALFADPCDAEELGVMMMQPARQERLRRRMARMGASRARDLFTWTGIAQQIMRLADGDPGGVEDSGDEWDLPYADL
jgi:mannosylfructose-phosphate synthase